METLGNKTLEIDIPGLIEAKRLQIRRKDVLNFSQLKIILTQEEMRLLSWVIAEAARKSKNGNVVTSEK